MAENNITKIQFRRDTAVNWTTNNPILALGEPAIETDSLGGIKYKVGDGITPWVQLPYQSADFSGIVNQVSQLSRQVIENANAITSIEERLTTAIANIEGLSQVVNALTSTLNGINEDTVGEQAQSENDSPVESPIEDLQEESIEQEETPA